LLGFGDSGKTVVVVDDEVQEKRNDVRWYMLEIDGSSGSFVEVMIGGSFSSNPKTGLFETFFSCLKSRLVCIPSVPICLEVIVRDL
jgi:hypothetical protein